MIGNENFWAREQKEKIDYERDVKLLIHGWNADADHTSMQPVRNAYLRLNASHVVSADWREIAAMPYIVARDLIGVIGKRICENLKSFMSLMKVSPGRIHIVGHSLGEKLAENVFILGKHSINCFVESFKLFPSKKLVSLFRCTYWNSCRSMLQQCNWQVIY